MKTQGIRWALSTLLVATPITATAATYQADPSNYRDQLSLLQPGDVLELAAGRYTRLTLQGVQGTSSDWISITGPTSGDPAIIEGESGHNTVQLYDCAYVEIKNLIVDVGGLYVDAINAKDSISHDILIEGNTLMNFPNDQQIVGISTKSTAWNWTIRRNHIIEPGTGLYLGNSNGDAPFIAGIVEENLVVRSVGYCMQIKQQNPYSLEQGMPAGPNVTIIRNNVFIKDDRPSTDGDRPNLLVSGFPESGPGAQDHYEIYGNFLHYNPRESLFQGAGRMSLHDNIFVGTGSGRTAMLITPHQGKDVQVAHVYNNTIYGVAQGIRISSPASESDMVVGNLVFADEPIGGSIADQRDNITDTIANAGLHVNAPSAQLGSMDFYPLPGQAQGSTMDLGKVASNVDYDRDFNGDSKGSFTFRGAYGGEGTNPGWTLTEAIKGGGASSLPDGGIPDGTIPTDGSTGPDSSTTPDGSTLPDGGVLPDGATLPDGAGPGVATTSDDSSGCACQGAAHRSEADGGLLIALVLGMGVIWYGRQTDTASAANR